MIKYIIIAGLSLALLTGTYLYGFQRGKLKTEIKVVEKVVEVTRESKRQADAVKKEEQSLSDPAIDSSLCSLGIVRQQQGCDQLPDLD